MVDTSSREHLMECLARQLLAWNPSWRKAFLNRWEKGGKGVPARGKDSRDELQALVNQEARKQTEAAFNARQEIQRQLNG